MILRISFLYITNFEGKLDLQSGFPFSIQYPNWTVIIEGSENSAFVFLPSFYYFQELSERIRFVVAVCRQGDAGGSTEEDNMVCLSICPLHRFQCGIGILTLECNSSGRQDRSSTRNQWLPANFSSLYPTWESGSAGGRSLSSMCSYRGGGCCCGQ